MTFLENVLAGLVVAFLPWGVHRARALWASRRDLSPKPEFLPMGKHRDPTRPDLPMGPQRELVELLKRLCLESGLSQREVAEEAKMSLGTVNKLLIGPKLPTKSRTVRAAGVLALRAVQTRTHLDRAGQEQALTAYDRQFNTLYDRAAEEAAGPHPAETAALYLWNQIARGAASDLRDRLTSDVWEAIGKSSLDTVTYDFGLGTVWLVIEVPDSYSYWAFEENGGPWDNELSWTEEFARALSHRVGMVSKITPFYFQKYDEEADAES